MPAALLFLTVGLAHEPRHSRSTSPLLTSMAVNEELWNSVVRYVYWGLGGYAISVLLAATRDVILARASRGVRTPGLSQFSSVHLRIQNFYRTTTLIYYIAVARFFLNMAACSIYVYGTYRRTIRPVARVLNILIGVVLSCDLWSSVTSSETSIVFVASISCFFKAFAIPSLLFARGDAGYLNFSYLCAFSVYESYRSIVRRIQKDISTTKQFVIGLFAQGFTLFFLLAAGMQMLEVPGDILSEGFIAQWEPLGDWHFFNSLYYVVITLTTVGYGDFSPETILGRLFSIFMVMLGVVVFAEAAGQIYEHLLRASGSGTFVKRANSRHVIVCGNPQLSDLIRFTSAFYAKNRLSNLSAKVVVMVEEPSWTEREWYHSLARNEFLKKRLEYLVGSVRNASDLSRARLPSADAVFFLTTPSSGAEPATIDTSTVIDSLAVRNYRTDVPIFTTVLLKRSLVQMRVAQSTASSIDDPELLFREHMHGDAEYHGLRREILDVEMRTVPKHYRISAQRSLQNAGDSSPPSIPVKEDVVLGDGGHVSSPGLQSARPHQEDGSASNFADVMEIPAQRGSDDLIRSSSICLQDIHAAVMAAHIKANGVGTLITNMVLDINPPRGRNEPAWLSEYHMGSMCDLVHLVLPPQLHNVRVDDIAVQLYDHGLVLLTTASDQSGRSRSLVLEPAKRLRAGDIGMFLTYHRQQHAYPALMLAALKHELDEAEFGEGRALDDEPPLTTTGSDTPHGPGSSDIGAHADAGGLARPENTISSHPVQVSPSRDGEDELHQTRNRPADVVPESFSARLNTASAGLGDASRSSVEIGVDISPENDSIAATGFDAEATASPSRRVQLDEVATSLVNGEVVQYGAGKRSAVARVTAPTGSQSSLSSSQANVAVTAAAAVALLSPSQLPRNDAVRAAGDAVDDVISETETDTDLDAPWLPYGNGQTVGSEEYSGADTGADVIGRGHDLSVRAEGCDGYIPEGISRHIILSAEGLSSLHNVPLLVKYIWRKLPGRRGRYRRQQRRKTPLVVICPELPAEFRASFSRYDGKCIFFVEDSPSSRATWRRAGLRSAKGVVMLADYSLPWQQSDARTIFSLMTLDTFISNDQDVFVVAELVEEKSLEFLREPHAPRRVGVDFGDEEDAGGDSNEQNLVMSGSLRSDYRRSSAASPTALGIPPRESAANSQTSDQPALRKRISNFAATLATRIGNGRNGSGSDGLDRGDAESRSGFVGSHDNGSFGDLPGGDEDAGTKSDLGRARRGTLLSRARYASGELLLPSAALTLLVREYLEPGFVHFYTELLGAGNVLGALKIRLVRVPSAMFDSGVSVSTIGSDRFISYRELFVRLMRLGCTPLGLYRSGAAPVRLPTKKRQHRGSDLDAECLSFIANNACSLSRKSEVAESRPQWRTTVFGFFEDLVEGISPQAQLTRRMTTAWRWETSTEASDDLADGDVDGLNESVGHSFGGARIPRHPGRPDRLPGTESRQPNTGAAQLFDRAARGREEGVGVSRARGVNPSTESCSEESEGNIAKTVSAFTKIWNAAAPGRRDRHGEGDDVSHHMFDETGKAGNKLPYVLTLPEPYTLVSERDGIYILCSCDFELPRSWGEGYAQGGINSSSSMWT